MHGWPTEAIMSLTIPMVPRNILLLEPNVIYATALRAEVERAVPGAMLTVVRTLEQVAESIRQRTHQMFITDVCIRDGDLFDLLTDCRRAGSTICQTLVVTAHKEERLLSLLQVLNVNGVFDPSSEDLVRFRHAVSEIDGGGRYWSPSITGRLSEIAHRNRLSTDSLTPTEELVLTVIGDGCDDNDAARLLGMSSATVQTVRRNIHRKLGVPQRGKLVSAASQLAYVRFTDTGIIRSGLAITAARANRSMQITQPRLPQTIKLHPSDF